MLRGVARANAGRRESVRIKLTLDSGGGRSEFFLKAFRGETVLDALRRELGHRLEIRKNALGEWIEAVDGVREREAAGWQGYIRGDNGSFGLPYIDTPAGAVFPGLGKIRIGKPVELLLKFDEGVSADITLACPKSQSYFEGEVWTCKLKAFTEELRAAQANALARMLAHPTVTQRLVEIDASRGIRLVMERARANAVKRIEDARGLLFGNSDSRAANVGLAQENAAAEADTSSARREASDELAEKERTTREPAFAESALGDGTGTARAGENARALFADVQPLREEVVAVSRENRQAGRAEEARCSNAQTHIRSDKKNRVETSERASVAERAANARYALTHARSSERSVETSAMLANMAGHAELDARHLAPAEKTRAAAALPQAKTNVAAKQNATTCAFETGLLEAAEEIAQNPADSGRPVATTEAQTPRHALVERAVEEKKIDVKKSVQTKRREEDAKRELLSEAGRIIRALSARKKGKTSRAELARLLALLQRMRRGRG
ncbi:MAG: hypothetical protein QXH27_00635 [Candidatus Micrarchaeia archaeon]